jgi:hypothetical protein
MAKLVPREEIKYEPEWNEEIQLFEDVCPFQSRRQGNWHVCYCMNKQNEPVMFCNASQFNAHILTNYHKLALTRYTTQKMISLRKELAQMNKEKAAIQVSAEAAIARERKVQSELREKIEKINQRYMNDIAMLNDARIHAENELAKAESLLRLQGDDIEKYFNKN